MLHEIILEQKAQYSTFTVNVFWVNFWGNLYHFIRGKGKKKKNLISMILESFQKQPMLQYCILAHPVVKSSKDLLKFLGPIYT